MHAAAMTRTNLNIMVLLPTSRSGLTARFQRAVLPGSADDMPRQIAVSLLVSNCPDYHPPEGPDCPPEAGYVRLAAAHRRPLPIPALQPGTDRACSALP